MALGDLLAFHDRGLGAGEWNDRSWHGGLAVRGMDILETKDGFLHFLADLHIPWSMVCGFLFGLQALSSLQKSKMWDTLTPRSLEIL